MGIDGRFLVGVVIGAGLVGTLGFVACSGPSKAPPGPVPRSTEAALAPTTAPSTSAPVAMAPTPVDGGPAPRDSAAGEASAAAARAASQCDDPLGAILNLPDGGVVFNNAMTSADAGSLDRGQGIIDALVGQARRFRCCFDPWLRAHPDQTVQLLLRVALDPSGKVTEVGHDSSRSNITDELAVACVSWVAEDTSYPPSPGGRATIVELPLRLEARPR